MRMVRLAARLFSIAGSTSALNWSNGLVSRKKKDSLVVIASTTSRDHRFVASCVRIDAHQIVEGRQLPLARDRQQPALEQVGLVVGQHEAGAFAAGSGR